MRLPWIQSINLTVLACSSLVHADAPPDRYSFPSAGVVYDTRTTLAWQQDVSRIVYPLDKGTNYCANLSLAGSGWRLPSLSELLTLVDLTQESPSIDKNVIPNTPPGRIWASSGFSNTSGARYIFQNLSHST